MRPGLVVPRRVCAAVVNLRGVEPLLSWWPLRNAVRRRGELRMAVIPDFKATTLSGFIQQHIAPGSTIYTDALKSFTGLDKAGYRHIARAQPQDNRIAQGSQIGRALGRPCYRQPPAMVDRYLPRCQPQATPSLPR